MIDIIEINKKKFTTSYIIEMDILKSDEKKTHHDVEIEGMTRLKTELADESEESWASNINLDLWSNGHLQISRIEANADDYCVSPLIFRDTVNLAN